MQKALTDFFTELHKTLNISPVLVDIGASVGSPSIWDPIAKFSTYVGFDPDLRDLKRVPDTPFNEAVIVNKAVVPYARDGKVNFYLTRSPYCSSTLIPDDQALEDYVFADLFEVVDRVTVEASTLEEVLLGLSLTRVDWLKTDSQGTDLRLFMSLDEARRDHVLALDVEPGLIDAYQGEDLFVDAHRAIIAEGFWSSRMEIMGALRMTPQAANELGLDPEALNRSVRASPGWVEGRYLRTVDHLASVGAEPNDYVLLWMFAMIDSQPGFGVDVTIAAQSRFGKDPIFAEMRSYSVEVLRRALRRGSARTVITRAIGKARSLLR